MPTLIPAGMLGISQSEIQAAVQAGVESATNVNSIDIALNIVRFVSNDVDLVSSTLIYQGFEDILGVWMIKKIDLTSGVSYRYATEINNGSYSTYATAWTNRATLTYALYEDVF